MKVGKVMGEFKKKDDVNMQGWKAIEEAVEKL